MSYQPYQPQQQSTNNGYYPQQTAQPQQLTMHQNPMRIGLFGCRPKSPQLFGHHPSGVPPRFTASNQSQFQDVHHQNIINQQQHHHQQQETHSDIAMMEYGQIPHKTAYQNENYEAVLHQFSKPNATRFEYEGALVSNFNVNNNTSKLHSPSIIYSKPGFGWNGYH